MSEENVIVPDAKVLSSNALDDPAVLARDVKWRAQAKILAEENETLKSTLAKQNDDLMKKIDSSTRAQQDLQQKFIDAEVKAHALAAGLKDLDFLKLVDSKAFSLKEDGTIDGIQKAIEDLKVSKPILFAEEKRSSSSKNEQLPNRESVVKVDAFSLSDADYQAQKAKLGLY